MESKRSIFLRGCFAMAAALVVLFAASTLFPLASYPPARIAAIVIAATPGDLATSMIERLGKGAIRTLSLFVNAGVVLAGGFVALWIARGLDRRRSAVKAALAGAAGFVSATLLAAFGPEGFTAIGSASYLAASFLYARYALGRPLLAELRPRLKAGETPLDAMRTSRRRFLLKAGTATAAVAVGATALYRFFFGSTNTGVRIVSADKPWVSPPDDPAFPSVEGLTPEVTPTSAFYNIDINIAKPAVDQEDWRLKIGGLVENPYELDYTTLQEQFEVVELAHTLTCISNEVGGDLISTAIWRGVRLRDVLTRGVLEAGVVDIVFRAADGYSDSIKVSKALEESTLVVFGMNGEPLPRKHGFPARIIVPGIYGMKNVKWLKSIEAVNHDYQGYWMVRGWSDEARIKTQSRIDVPTDGGKARPGGKVAGVAWAGDRKVSRVEVSFDEGKTWSEALMKRELSPVAWRIWAAELESGRGKKKIIVRSTDGNGDAQEAEVTRPHPDGSSGRHSIRVEVS